MSKLFKRGLSLLMALCMVLALVPAVDTVADAAAAEQYTLVTSVGELAAGDQIVIVASGYNYALSTTQNTNNRGQAAITKGDGTVTLADGVQVITLENGTNDGTFAFNVGNGYLYAASSSKNYLRTETTKTANSSWAISIDANGVATVKAQGSNTRNWLRYNKTSSIFATYGSGQQDISIYKLNTGAGETCDHSYDDGVETTPATCTEDGVKTFTCSKCGDTKTESIPAAGHNYVDGTCSVCGDQENDYSGRYYIATIRSSGNYFYMTNSLGTGSTKRYQAVDSGLTVLPAGINTNEADSTKAFVLEKNADGTYRIYAEGIEGDAKYLGWASDNSGTLVAADQALNLTVDVTDDGLYNIYFTGDAERYLSLNSTTGNNYFAFYKGTQSQNLSLIPVNENATTTHTVTWVDENGNTLYTEQVAHGADAPVKEIPTKTGYTGSWSGTTTNITADTIITAVYELNYYFVSFDMDGDGTFEQYYCLNIGYGTNLQAFLDEHFEINPNEVPNKEGYRLTGWKYFTDYNCTNEHTGSTAPDSDVYIQGQWEGNTYNVTWNVDGSNSMTEQTFGDKLTLPAVPTKDGYTFIGWFTAAEGGEQVTAETVFQNANNDTVYYARWEANSYNVYWQVDGQTVYTTTVKCGETITAPDSNDIEIPEGYYSVKWDSYPTTMGAEDVTVDGGYWTVYFAMVNENGDILSFKQCKLGETVYANYMGTYYKEGYTFYLVNYNDESERYTMHYESGMPIWPSIELTGNLTLKPLFEVNKYTLSIVINGTKTEYSLAYGEALPKITVDPIVTTDGKYTFCFWEDLDAENIARVDELPETMPAKDLNFEAEYAYVGWLNNNGERQFQDDQILLMGWFCVNDNNEPVTDGSGNWYYADEFYNVVTGINRVPYPEEAINGITYGPNAEDKAYWESHKDTSSYTDAESSLFVFGEDGKFQQFTGAIRNEDNSVVLHYAINGQLPWHIGLVQVGSHVYYFIGENVKAVGNVHVTRYVNVSGAVMGGIYTFGADGNLCRYDGITEIDGKLYYYDHFRLATDAGLIRIDGDYYYVRARSGELVVNAEYWVTDVKDFDLVPGLYSFDENGKLINPIDPTVYHGIVDIDGVLYYYQNGVKQSGAGVVDLVDENGKTFYIYVRSNGQLATGVYWPTTLNGKLDSGAYNWGDDGRYYPDAEPVKEIREEGGKYFYYVDGILTKGAGVVDMVDENGEIFYIYVRSNGQLATGIYWPTTRNGLLERGAYDWGTNGRYYPN